MRKGGSTTAPPSGSSAALSWGPASLGLTREEGSSGLQRDGQALGAQPGTREASPTAAAVGMSQDVLVCSHGHRAQAPGNNTNAAGAAGQGGNSPNARRQRTDGRTDRWRRSSTADKNE